MGVPKAPTWNQIAAVAAIAMATMIASCSSTPRETYADLQDTFISGVRTLNAAYDSGDISQEDWDETVWPAIKAGDAALDAYDAATAAGMRGESALGQLKDALDALRPWILDLE